MNGIRRRSATLASTFYMEESMAVTIQDLQAAIERFPRTALAELPHAAPRLSAFLRGARRKRPGDGEAG